MGVVDGASCGSAVAAPPAGFESGGVGDDETARIAAVRRFNRFYTRHVGALNETLLESPYTLTQMRVLYEVFHHAPLAAQSLGATLALDAGYLSRILAGFEADGVIERHRDEADRRKRAIRLSERGREMFAPYDRASAVEVSRALSHLDQNGRAELVAAMARVEALLQPGVAADGEGDAARVRAPGVLRDPRPGDFGWIIHRHGALYANEYGFDASFEALVAEIVAEFARTHDPAREKVWIADVGGSVAGSVFLVRKSEAVAKLRLLYLEPRFRGLGIGRRLVDACIEGARARGYAELELWTNGVLTAARRLYETSGFVLVASEPHNSFGCDLVGETWRLTL